MTAVAIKHPWMLVGSWFLSKIPCFVSADDTMHFLLHRVSQCLCTGHYFAQRLKSFLPFSSHTSGCCEDQAPGTEKSFP